VPATHLDDDGRFLAQEMRQEGMCHAAWTVMLPADLLLECLIFVQFSFANDTHHLPNLLPLRLLTGGTVEGFTPSTEWSLQVAADKER
jgi:hypothetical protein